MRDKKAHFIGIGGVGMTAAAMLLQEEGWEISGTDPGAHPPSSTFLEERGIEVSRRYDPSNIPAGTTLVVAGGGAKVDPSLNDEVAAAHARDEIEVLTFPELLARITEKTSNIVVAGSYGKSTCTTLIAWILEQSGLDPGYFIGAFPQQLASPGSMGAGRHFVIEGDEYPTSGLDRLSKFLHFRADDLLVTSLEHDHVNVFATQGDYLRPFEELVRQVASAGIVVGCADDRRIPELLGNARCRTVTYGLDESSRPDWSAVDVCLGERTRFSLRHQGAEIAQIETTLLGRHNVENILGCAALLLEKGLVDPSQAVSAVSSFRGLQRRLNLISDPSASVAAYEGFGSSRVKARAAISAMRAHFGGRRLVTLFEPYAFSWRNRSKLHWYEDAFADVDALLVYKPPTLGASRHDQLTHEEIFETLRRSHPDVTAVRGGDEALAALEAQLREGDILLVLTSGDMDGLVAQLAPLVDERFGT